MSKASRTTRKFSRPATIRKVLPYSKVVAVTTPPPAPIMRASTHGTPSPTSAIAARATSGSENSKGKIRPWSIKANREHQAEDDEEDDALLPAAEPEVRRAGNCPGQQADERQRPGLCRRAGAVSRSRVSSPSLTEIISHRPASRPGQGSDDHDAGREPQGQSGRTSAGRSRSGSPRATRARRSSRSAEPPPPGAPGPRARRTSAGCATRHVRPMAPDRYKPKHRAQTGSWTPARWNERSGRW